MTAIILPVYSEQDLTPASIEVIRGVLDARFPDHQIRFMQVNGTRVYDKVLVFGTRGPATLRGGAKGVEYIYTYSIAQIMTKANAASVLEAGIRQFINEPEPIPFDKPRHVGSYDLLYGYLDFDKPTAIDIETSGNLSKEDTTDTVGIISIAFYQKGYQPVVVHNGSFPNNKMNDLNVDTIETLRDVLPRFTKAIYHNGKFDIRVLNRVLDVQLVNWFDTMLAHHVLNIAAGDHKLKTLARRYLGAPEWEADLKKYLKQGGHYELIPEDRIVEYNGWDVYWTYKLWEFLAPQIEADENNQMAFELEMSAADFFLDLETYGIPLDAWYIDTYRTNLKWSMSEDLTAMQEITDDPKFNPNSPKQIKTYLENCGYPVHSTDADHLAQLLEIATKAGDTHTALFLQKLASYRKNAKVKGTYVEGWSTRSRNNRVHPTYLVHGTSTGRISSTNPNAQNVPRDKKVRGIVATHG